jgi:hypothetical protein
VRLAGLNFVTMRLAAAKKTGQSVAHAQILGTTPEKVVNAYTQNPAGAVEHSFKTSIVDPAKKLLGL